MAPHHSPRTPRGPAAWAPAAAGAAGAGVALATGELAAGLSDAVPSLVVAVGEAVVDHTPGDLVALGIGAAGTGNKPILLAGIVVVSLLVGAGLGRLASRRRRSADAGFVMFGVLGAWAASRNPFSSTSWSWFVAGAAVLAGVSTVRVLLAVAELPATAVPRRGGADPAFPTRRAFITLTAGTATVALAVATAGRYLGRSGGSAVTAARQAITLPPAAVPVQGPAAVLDAAVPGITPYITPNDRFFRIDTALSLPRVDPTTWRLDVDGLVDEPYSLSLDDIMGMDLVEETVTLACVSNEVGGQLVGTATWLGVPLSALLERAGVRSEGAQVVGRSVDGFDAAFPTELAFDGRTALLAVGMNGEPLPVRHGFPARLVVAGLYGYVSAVKWIDRIRLEDADYRGYWIPRGWSRLGPVKIQSRIDVPRGRSRVAAGRVAVAGVAWAPVHGVERVEVQIDGGEWRPCRLGDATSDETWVQWVTDWDATPGAHTIAVRATDRTGSTQSPLPVGSRPNGAEGHHSVRVTVS